MTNNRGTYNEKNIALPGGLPPMGMPKAGGPGRSTQG